MNPPSPSVSNNAEPPVIVPMDSLRRVPSLSTTTATTEGISVHTPVDSTKTTTDMANPALFSKPFQAYSPSIKYTFYSSTIDIRQAWSLNGLIYDGEGREQLIGQNAEPFWIDLATPSSEDLSKLAATFGIHPLTVEDIQVADSREKCEIFDRYLFTCVRSCDQKFLTSAAATVGVRRGSAESGMMDLLAPATLYILVFRNFVISVHHETIPHIRRVLRRLYALKTAGGFALSSDWVMYSLLDDAVDEFGPQMQTLELEVDTIDELVLFLSHTEQSDMLRRIGRARKRVTHLLRLLKPKIDILKVLTVRSSDFIRDHTMIYLRDVNDHVLTNLQNLEQYAETLNRSHSNYLAQISIELNEASNRMNIVMKKLTAAAALVLPLSLISGIWGMNVPVPGQAGVEGVIPLIPFFLIVFFMCALMAGMYYVGKQNDWW